MMNLGASRSYRTFPPPARPAGMKTRQAIA